MLGHTDGAESNALSMKRRLDEHKDDEGQSDKRHKNEQGAASTSSTAGKAAAPEQRDFLSIFRSLCLSVSRSVALFSLCLSLFDVYLF